MISWRRCGLVAAGFCLLLLGGCGGWFGEADEPPLPGERVSVLLYEGDLAPDPRISDQAVALPPPYRNASWTQVGGGSLHAVGHVAGPTKITRPAWRTSFGSGAGRYRPLMTAPVVARDRVYAMDSRYRVSAYGTAKGRKVWQTGLTVPKRDGEAFGGGIAYELGRIYISTGFGTVAAIDAEDGAVLWTKTVPGPVRAAPLVMDGQVFVVTVDNQLVALDAATGDRQWRHAGFAETTALLGSAAPAGLDGTVIVPYSSGEVFALRAVNGRPTWSDNLAAVRRVDAASSLADIRALPVTDGNLVYAVSHSGRMVAIDLRTGARAWERNIGGVRTPWIAGNWIFVLNNEAQVVCLSRRDGRVRWIVQLDKYEKPKQLEDPIHWIGPMAVGGQLLVIGGHGRGLAIDASDGGILETFKVPDEIMAAAVADGTLYLQTEDADLLAYR
ncbi:MAG: PQQ-like beta-propeller repeat protein [Alphaproteobacteria bacterium]|nr:PQQ-like beta-propeller repeat protein [Alphaproteobacteria bacterium]